MIHPTTYLLYLPNGTSAHRNPSTGTANCPSCTSAQRGAEAGIVVAPPALATLVSVLRSWTDGGGDVAEVGDIEEVDGDVEVGDDDDDVEGEARFGLTTSSLRAGWKIAMPG